MTGRFLGVLACLLILPWSAPVAPCPRGTLTGEVTYVRDGDTIELAEMAVRLSGLAAPEWNESRGAEARKAMIDLVRGRIVRCELDGTRTYDRCAGICYLDGVDISEVLVVRAWPGIAPGSATDATPRLNAELLSRGPRSAGHTRCRSTAGNADA